jgi:cytochrome c-type biogenesis protein CcmH/NrfG
LAWSLRFSQPFNTYFALLSEGGILTALSIVFIFFLVLGYILHSWFIKNKFDINDIGVYDRQGAMLGDTNIQHLDLWTVMVVWLVLLIGMAFNFFGPVLWYLWWLLLGLVISGLSIMGYGVLKQKSKTLADTPQYNLVFSFSLIIVIAVVVMVGVLGVRFYWAEVVYAKALKSTDYKTAESWLKKSSYLHQNSDVYHVALAQVYLGQAGQEAQKQKSDVQGVASLMALAVNEARYATELSPNVVGIWENLATMYENASVLVPQAGEWTIKSLDKAIELEPTNAYLYWRLANNYILAKNYSKATENFKKAINLKTDYLGGYIGLARSYEANNEVDNAVDTYKKGLSVGGTKSAEFLFDYGRVLYNRNKGTDRKDAEQLWLAAVKLQPSYSNALYSLGLLYEVNGDKASALQYYYKVKDLNPSSSDVIAKINSLLGVSSRPAVTSTSTKATGTKKK